MTRTSEDATCARCEHFTAQRDIEAAKEGTGYCLILERPVRFDAWACGPLWDKARNMNPRTAYIAAQRAREEQQSQPKESA